MNRPQLILAPGKEKSLLRRHPWLFSGAVRRVEGTPAEGDLVDVCDASGHWLATGHYQPESIICKILSFDSSEVDDDFFHRRLQSAVDYRASLGLFADSATNVFRLVHAEGDGLPGLVADWYNGVLVLQAHSEGMHRQFPLFARLFAELLAPYGIRSVFDKSSATLPARKLHDRSDVSHVDDRFVWGDELDEHEVLENGIRLIVNFFEGQKTGFFIDQRENRHLVQTLARNRRLLNCFGYTGGFSLAALRGGAAYVETVDISKRAIECCNRNVQLNFGTEANHRGVVADALPYMASVDNRFDFIILDPPAFAKNHRSLQQGLRGYRAINQRAIEQLQSGGFLMTFSCSQAVSKDDFQTMVFTAAANARRRVRIVRQLPHAVDHPVSIFHPEGEYLKGLLLQVE